MGQEGTIGRLTSRGLQSSVAAAVHQFFMEESPRSIASPQVLPEFLYSPSRYCPQEWPEEPQQGITIVIVWLFGNTCCGAQDIT